jgi:valyl-tRNA synthetase
VLAVLLYVLGQSMKLLHPLMPYVTEEIWSALPMAGALLIENRYPAGDTAAVDEDAEGRMRLVRDVVVAVRNIRAAYGVNPGQRVPVVRVRAPEDGAARLREAAEGVLRLSGAESLEVGPGVAKEKGSAATPIGEVEVIVPLAGVVDFEAERARLEKEKQKVEKELGEVGAKLGNEGFVAKAKPEVVARERERQGRLETERAKLVESLRLLGAEA